MPRQQVSENAVRACFFPIILCAFAAPVQAESLQVTGYAGYAGEWELSATVTETAAGRTKEYAGPLTMTHIGLCTQDGPEQKAGEMRLQISAASSRVSASLSAPGLACTYSGKLSDAANGAMTCADRQLIPLKLSIK